MAFSSDKTPFSETGGAESGAVGAREAGATDPAGGGESEGADWSI